ncbi:MAG: hypothetical protein L0226_00510 [Acidobacteria bacterium]|nr:hypothetical protein [Acidobacteriota bacterium]
MFSRGEKFDWSKTWVAEMFLSEEEQERRKEERERRLGITPEHKVNDHLKAGMITAFVSFGAMIFLYFFLDAVAPHVPGVGGSIIDSIFLVALIPLMIGIAIVVNSLVIDKRTLRSKESQMQTRPQSTPATAQLESRIPISSDYGVTENTTEHLSERVPEDWRRESR